MGQKGILISIDFELDWGYTNSKDPLEKSEVLEGLDRLISLFEKHNVKTTWATVGKLFENSQERDTTKKQFNWISKNLVKNDLVEIASHTYSHLFCEEVSADMFEKDISEMEKISLQKGIRFKSIVFPRNQYSYKSLKILSDQNYTHTRSVLPQWYLKTSKYTRENKLKKYLVRFYELIPLNRDVIVKSRFGVTEVSDSRFFRFFSPSILGRTVSRFYLMLLKREMSRCIKRGGIYHIWFHPHNIIKKPHGFNQLDIFLSYYNKIKMQEKSVSSYKLSEIDDPEK
ncbi:polysaccharide deacetylase family protein [Salinimicrobium sp. CAU 1759]